MKKRSLAVIIAVVVIFHAVFIFWAGRGWTEREIKDFKKLVVKTVALNPIIEKKESPKKTGVSVAKQTDVNAVPVQPKTKAKPKKPAPSVAKKADTKQRELLAKAQESVAKINQSRDKHSSSQEKALPELKMPDSLPQLHLDGIELVSDQETSYQVELASRLRLLLRLPEYGDVKIRLTVSKAGRVEKVEIIGSESKLNSQYVENTLPSLQLPPFGNQLGNTSKYTFAITLSND